MVLSLLDLGGVKWFHAAVPMALILLIHVLVLAAVIRNDKAKIREELDKILR